VMSQRKASKIAAAMMMPASTMAIGLRMLGILDAGRGSSSPWPASLSLLRRLGAGGSPRNGPHPVFKLKSETPAMWLAVEPYHGGSQVKVGQRVILHSKRHEPFPTQPAILSLTVARVCRRIAERADRH